MQCKNRYYILLLSSVIAVSGCKKDLIDQSDENANGQPSRIAQSTVEQSVMDVSFDARTTIDYATQYNELSDLDLASVNPYEDAQHIEMSLYENGQVDMTITELNVTNKIQVPTHILPDDSPQIVRTEIQGNSISFYDANSNLLGSEEFTAPNQLELVESISDGGEIYSVEQLNQSIATMQGLPYMVKVTDYIANPHKHGMQIVEKGANHVTLKMPASKEDPTAKGEIELVIDTRTKQLIGNNIYDENKQLVQSSLFGYSNGKEKYLCAVKTENKVKLPSGKDAVMLTQQKIDKLKIKVNKIPKKRK